jgi:hypothetical protein
LCDYKGAEPIPQGGNLGCAATCWAVLTDVAQAVGLSQMSERGTTMHLANDRDTVTSSIERHRYGGLAGPLGGACGLEGVLCRPPVSRSMKAHNSDTHSLDPRSCGGSVWGAAVAQPASSSGTLLPEPVGSHSMELPAAS